MLSQQDMFLLQNYIGTDQHIFSKLVYIMFNVFFIFSKIILPDTKTAVNERRYYQNMSCQKTDVCHAKEKLLEKHFI